MLRTIFVIGIILFGGFYAVQGAFYFLLFYLWYAYFRPDAWIYWLTWVQSLNLSLFLGIGVLVSTALSVPKLRFNLSLGLMMLFLLHGLLSTLFSAHPADSWDAWWMFLRVWLISYTIVVLVTDVQRYRMVLLVIALSLGFEAAKEGWAIFVLNPGGTNDNPLPFMGDNNGVAVGMMMLVPLFGALAHTTARRWERVVYWVFGSGVFLRGLATYSRGGFLSAIVLAIVYLIQSRRKVRTLASLVLVGSLALSVMPKEFWNRMNTITAPAAERDDSARGRLYFWEVAKDMAAANPVLGVGFGGFGAAYNEYDKSNGQFGGDRAVHSTWFGLLSETGYVGFTIFALLFLLVVWNLFRIGLKRKNEKTSEIAIYSRALMTSLFTFAAGGSFVNLQYNEMLWHFLALGVVLQLLSADVPAADSVPAARISERPVYPLDVRVPIS